MSYHGYDPGDRNNWYQSPQLGLFPASPTGYGVGYYCLPSYHPHGTRFPSQQSYPPPPPQFPSQPSYSPPPSATIINGYVFPHQFPHLSANHAQLSTATPSPHNYPCSRNQSYSSPGLLTTTPQSPLTPVHPHPSEISLHYAPTQPYFVPTNHFVPPPSTHEQPRLISDLKQVEPALQLHPISMELDQVHKDQLEARISKEQDSFEVIRAQQSTIQAEILAELRQLRLDSKNPVRSSMDGRSVTTSRRSLKPKLEQDFVEETQETEPDRKSPAVDPQDPLLEIRAHVKVLDSTFSAFDADHAAAKVAARALVELAKNEDNLKDLVECGAVPALVNHLRAPPPERGGSHCPIPSEHEVEKESAFALNLIAVKPENQHLIVDAGGLSPLIDLLKRHKSSSGSNAGAVDGVIRRAADAICNVSHENSNIKNLVRIDGGIPPLVELLNFFDTKVQRAAVGALKILAFKNDENKNQIVECNALPNLVLMLRSEIATMTYEAVGVIGNLVHSSPSIKKLVLLAGALQPVIDLLSSPCLESQREAALLLGQFATADSDCKAHIVQRGAVQPLIKMLQSPDSQVKEMSAFAIGRLAQDTHNQAGIAHIGGIVPLLKLLDSKNESLQHNAAFALYKEGNIVALIKFGIVQKFEDGEFFVQRTKDCVEGKICGRVSNNLLYLMRVTNEDVQSRIALAFAHLCKHDDCHVIFIEHKGMKLLLGLLESKSLQLQHDGSLALHKMATKATPLSLDVIAESLMVVAQALCTGLHIILAYTFYQHCSMVVEASIILRYFSLLHSFLDSVDFRSAMLNFIQYWSCLVHARDYLFMTYTIHTLSLPVATMFITDVTGGNLYLFEVAVLHFLCQTKAICHPRRFFVDEVIDFLKSNLKSSFLRYYFDPLRPSYNCGCFVTNMHKFFQYMVGHIHKDELFMTTCPSIFYTPFHALVRKLFFLSPMVAVHSLQLLLADILRKDAQFILGIMMVLSMNELMLLNSKKQGLEIGECPLEAMWLSVDVIELHMNFLENHMKLDEKCLGYVMSALDALYRMQKLRFKFIYQNLLQLFFPYVSVFVMGEEFRSDLFYMQPAGLGKKMCRLGHGKTHNFCSLSDDAHTLGLLIINRASAFLLLRVTQIAQINRAANICLEHCTVFLEKRGVENVHKWGWYKLRIVVNAIVGVDYFFQAATMREFRQEDAGNGIPLVFAPNIQDSEKDGGLIVNDEDVRAGVVLHDDGMMIVEDDITDGDKEPTIPLLWNMFVHLQLPLVAKKTTLADETCKIQETMDGSINADSPPIFSGFRDLALTLILYSLWLIRAWHKSMGYLPFEDSNYPTMPWFIYIFLGLGVTLCSGHVAADTANGYGFQMISCKGAQILIQNMKLEDKFV